LGRVGASVAIDSAAEPTAAGGGVMVGEDSPCMAAEGLKSMPKETIKGLSLQRR